MEVLVEDCDAHQPVIDLMFLLLKGTKLNSLVNSTMLSISLSLALLCCVSSSTSIN